MTVITSVLAGPHLGGWWKPTMSLRVIVPEGTTTEFPKLQQLWIEQGTGKPDWRTIPREVVTNAEFLAS